MGERRYRAFLSYSHRDRQVAEWLHKRLENYRLPPGLVDHSRSALRPIFKDREELPASDNLGEAIEGAIARSEALIVLCSPSAAVSPWIAKEIDCFKRLHGDSRVFLALVDGEPPYNIPPPLLVHYNDGQPTEDRTEPIAADLRPEGDGRRLGVEKLVAGIAGVELDDLVDRQTRQRNRRMAAISALSLVGMVIAIGLALYAQKQRDAAREERAQANGLVEYMLTDLRKQLEPVGRLDLLDGVGAKAMDYYAAQNLDSLNADELGRRARAVQLVAEIHNLRGDNEKALPAFREAARTTSELLARNPDDPQRMYDHGQSMFWVGYIAWQRGQMDEAKRAMEGYADISKRLAAKDRKNLDWQMEEAYSYSNLGTLESDAGRFSKALPLFQRSVAIISKVAKQEGRPAARLIELGEGLSWVATEQNYLGDFAASTATRRQEIALYNEVMKAEPDNYDAMRSRVFARSEMGWLLGQMERRSEARTFLEAAVADARVLLEQDPENTMTKEMSNAAFENLAQLDWREGKTADATRNFDRAGALIADLRRRDPANKDWNLQRPASLELTRALTDRSGGSPEELSATAGGWLRKLDRKDPSLQWQVIAAHVVDALAKTRRGDTAGAAAAYARAIAVESEGEGLNVNALALRAVAAERLGQADLAAQLRATLRERRADPAIDDRIPRS
ncbi:TIR domain-containing protein [Qipengyuania soli]|uniref:TIR domain-containing protein n=1 Tax=Qipengyuania soli TaxID=2782568 RepID=UPI002483928B|nr:TIR domain-containing protein [Qipengyuania soli]